MLERFTKDQKEAMDRIIEEIGPGVSSARSADKMVHVLMDLGWDPDSAEQFVFAIHGTMRRYVVSDAGRAALGKFYHRCMWLGIVWAAAGALIGLSAWAAAAGLPGAQQTPKALAAAGILSIIGWTSTTAGIVYFLRGLLGNTKRA